MRLEKLHGYISQQFSGLATLPKISGESQEWFRAVIPVRIPADSLASVSENGHDSFLRNFSRVHEPET